MEYGNIIDLVQYYIRTDECKPEVQSERVRKRFMESSDETKKIIDSIFISLCGYSLSTIIGDLDKNISEPRY